MSSSLFTTTVHHPQAIELTTTINSLISLKKKVTTPLLFKHVRKCRWEKVLERLNYLKLNNSDEALYRNKGGNTALHYACYRNPPYIVIKRFLELFPMLAFMENNFRSNPFHLVCIYGSSDVVIELFLNVQHGKKNRELITTMRNMEGATPLHNACWKKTFDNVLRVTLNGNKNVASWVEIHGLTPLHVLMWNKPTLSRVEMLLKAYPGACLISSLDEKSTPLHFAVKHIRRLDIIEVLLDGVGIKATSMLNKYGATPLHVAISTSRSCGHLYENGMLTSTSVMNLLVEADPAACRIQDCTGATPLHLACCYDNSHEIIRNLVYAYPQAKVIQDKSGCTPLHCLLSRGDTLNETTNFNVLEITMLLYSKTSLCLKDEAGATVLHRACIAGVSEKVIYFLYIMFPQAATMEDSNGRTPLHILFMRNRHSFDLNTSLENLMSDELLMKILTSKDLCETTFLKKDCLGNTLLHYAIKYNFPCTILKQLLQRNPDASFLKNNQGFSPLSLFWKEFLPILQHHYSFTKQEWNEVDSIPFDFWKKVHIFMMFLLKESKQVFFEKKEISLYVACALPTPPLFISLLLHLYPHQVYEKDETGRLPLHYAAAADILNLEKMIQDDEIILDELDDVILRERSEMYTETNTEFMEEDGDEEYFSADNISSTPDSKTKFFSSSVIELLLQANPKSASSRDNQGRLPLHIACASGNKIWLKGGIKSLLYAEPSALNIKDDLTGLFPFMLAATSPLQSTEDDKNIMNDDCSQIELVFQLLVNNPTLIHHHS